MSEDDNYLKGTQNRLIRYYFYLENGLRILNEFRNLGLGIFALYFALKLTNPVWMVVMFFPSVIILTVVGYYSVHRVAKVKEWVSMKFSTHYAIRNYDYTKESQELLKEIRDLLQKHGDS